MFVVYLVALILSLTIVFVSFFILVIVVDSLFLLKTGVPYVSSGKEGYDEIFRKIPALSQLTVYDLGCGNGEFLFEAADRGAKKCIGYELSFFPFFSAMARSIFRGRGIVNIYWCDFMKVDLREADIIYLYLVPKAINKVYQKIIQEVSSGTIVITKGSQLPNCAPDDKIVTDKSSGYGLYIYKIK